MEMVIDCIPGLEGIRLKNLPTFLRTTNPDDIMLNFPMREVERAGGGTAMILNTFDGLENDIVKSLSNLHLPPIYTLGPLHLLLKQNDDDDDDDDDLNSIASNLRKEETECLNWLSTKPPRSVVYVNFGSVTVMTSEQLEEFASGLANSGHNFLWIVRPDLVDDNGSSSDILLPEEFAMETVERGMVAKWCPQEEVLRHPSVGGFLTHSGWNSTVESVSCGAPMVTWPFFADQQTTSWMCSEKWKVGIEVCEGDAERCGIERIVRELMRGEKGKEMRKRASLLRNIAEEATASSPLGSSRLNLDRLIRLLSAPLQSNINVD